MGARGAHLAMQASKRGPWAGRKQPPLETTDPRIIKAINGLSSKLRYFILCEWFYSGVDRDYFNSDNSEFNNKLRNMGLGGVTNLTRTEWSAVRAKMGRRRRFSSAYLKQERQELYQYREQLRCKQMQGVAAKHKHSASSSTAATGSGFEYEVPAPMTVGQRVTAVHNGKGVLAIGSILTADMDSGQYRVQFDRQELGVEICCDTDVMPHGTPSVLMHRRRRASARAHGAANGPNGRDHSGRSRQAYFGAGQQSSSPYAYGHAGALPHLSPCLLANAAPHAADADVRLLVGIVPVLKRKQALLRALAEMNQEAAEVAKQGKPCSQVFKEQYAWVLVNLQEANRVLQPAMRHFQQRFKAQGKARNGSGDSDATEAWLVAFNDMCSRTAKAMVWHFSGPPSRPTGPCDNQGGPQQVSSLASSSLAQRQSGGEPVALHTSQLTQGASRKAKAQGPQCQWSSGSVLAATTNKGAGTAHSMDIQERVVAALSLVIGLRSCAEDNVRAPATRAAISRVSQALRPTCRTNFPLFSQISKVLGTLQTLVGGNGR